MKEKGKVSFSKTDSLALKGIAIILLLCLHCFGRAWRFEGYEIITYPLPMNTFISLNEYCRVCVPIFAFISGYGLYLSAKEKAVEGYYVEKWIIERYFKTFKGYWFIYVVSVIVLLLGVDGYIQNNYFIKNKISALFYIGIDFLGVSKIFGTPSLNGSWWYMGATLTYIIMMPLVVKWVKKFGFISLIGLVIIIPRVLLENKFLGAADIYSIMLSVIMGSLFAEKELFCKFDQLKITKKKWIDDSIIFIILSICIGLNIYIWVKVSYKELWEYHFVLIPISVILFSYKYIINIPVVRNVLIFLGKHSMNIFLFHTFLRSRIMHEFLYSLKVPAFTVLVLLGVTLVFSIAVEQLKKIIKYDFFIGKIEEKIMTLIL